MYEQCFLHGAETMKKNLSPRIILRREVDCPASHQQKIPASPGFEHTEYTQNPLPHHSQVKW